MRFRDPGLADPGVADPGVHDAGVDKGRREPSAGVPGVVGVRSEREDVLCGSSVRFFLLL